MHIGRRVAWLIGCWAMLTTAAIAYPTGETYVIQLRSTQASSGFAEYYIPSLKQALDASGLIYRPDDTAAYTATVETGSDVGKWYGKGQGNADTRTWLHTRFVTVGLSPKHIDVEPVGGKIKPAFAVKVNLLTPDSDRVDELRCLVGLAVRELQTRYRPKGLVTVSGQSCSREQQ
jgi:hypothetical protein